jgi:hypothetical protein
MLWLPIADSLPADRDNIHMPPEKLEKGIIGQIASVSGMYRNQSGRLPFSASPKQKTVASHFRLRRFFNALAPIIGARRGITYGH